MTIENKYRDPLRSALVEYISHGIGSVPVASDILSGRSQLPDDIAWPKWVTDGVAVFQEEN